MRRAIFTSHAFDRVQERLSLSHEEVAAILNYDLVILIGRERETFRVHRLFFSTPDKQCFVAVQDETNGEVVTILPIDFSPWRVSFEAQCAAEALMRDRPPSPHKPSADAHERRKHRAPLSTMPPSRFIFSATFRLPDGCWHTRRLGSIPAEPYAFYHKRAARDPSVLQRVRTWIRVLEQDGAEGIICNVRLGNSGSPMVFPCLGCNQ